jgi:hypothetical protein
MSQQVYGPFSCTICGPEAGNIGYIAEGGVLPYCARHHESRKAKREREFRQTLHPSTLTSGERKAAYYAEKRRQREQYEDDLIRQVDDERGVWG